MTGEPTEHRWMEVPGWLESLVSVGGWRCLGGWCCGLLGKQVQVTQDIFLFFMAYFHIDIILSASPTFLFLGVVGVVENLPF